MRWTVHGERTVYDSDWVRVSLVDVEVPGGRRFEHHAVRRTAEAVAVVVHDPGRGVLLLWRHRFITDRWGWEVPAGRVEPGESLEEAAAREALEETGWRPGPLRRLTSYDPTPGVSDHRFHVFRTGSATYMGEPSDPSESERVEWVPVEDVRRLVADGGVPDGLTLTALLWAMTLDELAEEPSR
jgi:8-oxo-dGTP pyrophosphatase MutT (NUDIX family)